MPLMPETRLVSVVSRHPLARRPCSFSSPPSARLFQPDSGFYLQDVILTRSQASATCGSALPPIGSASGENSHVSPVT